MARTTLAEIHRDPEILDRAISQSEPLEILTEGEVLAILLPKHPAGTSEARRVMSERFANPDWSFSVGNPLSREERNARG